MIKLYCVMSFSHIAQALYLRLATAWWLEQQTLGTGWWVARQMLGTGWWVARPCGAGRLPC